MPASRDRVAEAVREAAADAGQGVALIVTAGPGKRQGGVMAGRVSASRIRRLRQ